MVRRKKVSLPSGKPRGIQRFCALFSRLKVNLRWDEPSGIQKSRDEEAS